MGLKKCDRAVCYDVEHSLDRNRSRPHRTTGTILGVLEDGTVLFTPDFDKDSEWIIHEKQCRKLVKKELRHVWISYGVNHDPYIVHESCGKKDFTFQSANASDEVVEFIEVKSSLKKDLDNFQKDLKKYPLKNSDHT